MLKQSNQPNGFTLIEALVAITILIIGVLGPLAMAVNGITNGLYVQNELAANYLAQEAMETVAWSRNASISALDSNGSSWASWISTVGSLNCANPDNASQSCSVNPTLSDPNQVLVSGCNTSGAKCDRIFDTVQQQYTDSGTSNPTLGPVFTRYLFLTPVTINGQTEVKITVVMSWMNKATPRTIVFTSHLYPLQP